MYISLEIMLVRHHFVAHNFLLREKMSTNGFSFDEGMATEAGITQP